MNLNKNELEELNALLRDPKLDIPDYRRTVTESGFNLAWLQKNISKRNKNINPRVKELLKIK